MKKTSITAFMLITIFIAHDVYCFDLAEYFPITPNRSWNYSVRELNSENIQIGSWKTKIVLQDFETFNGVQTVPQAYYDSDYGNMELIDNRNFFSTDANWIYLHGEEQVGNPSWNDRPLRQYIYNPPLSFKRHSDIGQIHRSSTTVINPSGERQLISITLQVVGFEDVSVPAGQFKQCVKIRFTSSSEPDEFTYWWWAKGFGEVKSIEYEVDNEIDITELTAYSINGVTYPHKIGPMLNLLLDQETGSP